jgi:hypothetical protein
MRMKAFESRGLMRLDVRGFLGALGLIALLSFPASAQTTSFQDSLLDCMVGHWVLRGTIGGQETTHDVTAEWVLGHEYLELHEVSIEKDADGRPAYEAIVFIGSDQRSGGYSCLWLDSTGGGGLAAQAIGHGERSGDTIPFLFTGSSGSVFHTTFAYNWETRTWRWLMDSEEGGKLQPFARVDLRRP